MKRYIFILSIILLSAVSCVHESTFESRVNVSDLEVKLNGVIDKQFVTKADDKGFYDGDAFGVYITDYNSNGADILTATGNQADNVRFVFDAESGNWNPDIPLYFADPESSVSVIGYYPYTDDLDSPNAYPFEVARDQRKPAANGILGGYEASDFLYAVRRNLKPTSDIITLYFRHKLANFKITLLKGAGWSDEEWNQVSKDVLITNTVRQSVIDLSNGSVRTEGDDRSIGIVPMDMGNNIWRAVVVPQEVPSGSPIVSITIDGQSREYLYDGAYTYYDGKQNSLTLSVNKTPGVQGFDMELISEGITPWEDDANVREESSKGYLVINCPEAGKLKETILNEGYQLESIKNLKVEGILNENDFYFMRDELPILQAVNLMEVNVDECLYEINLWAEGGGYWSTSYQPFSNGIPDRAFYEKKSLKMVVLPNKLSRLGKYSFRGTSIRGTIIIPEGVKVIGWGAFCNIASSFTVSLPSTLREIELDAFSGSALRGDLVLPSGLEIIRFNAFDRTDITSVTLPSSIVVLANAFTNCTRLTGSIVFPSGIKSFSGFSGCNSLNGELILHEGLEQIQDYAVNGCPLSGPLVIPSTVNAIGTYAFADNSFNSISLPESLTSLGPRAFWTTHQCVGEGFDLTIPEGITFIPQYCFSGPNIINLTITKNVELIEECAFAYCYNIGSIVCEATQPPILGNGVFDGVAKDNFALEVPESSVELYQNASGWNEFKRIVAHRDFSISRRLFRAMNKAETRSFTLRAESGVSWTVASKPDWVTVSPMSGTGKVEVTVTVSALAKGAGNREGEIVYKLDGKDYSASTKVEQYDYQYGDGDVYTVQNHSKGRGVHLVFMGDCYDAKDISEGKYLENTMEAVEHFFAIEPYNTYKDYFDVHIVFGKSEDSGIGDVNTIREAKFGSQYSLTEGVMFDDSKCLAYAAKVYPFAPSIAGICLVLNSDLEEGVTCLYDNDLFISLCPMGRNQYPNDFRGIVQHEAGGHGFGKLGEETINDPTFIQTCPVHCPQIIMGKALGWYDNLSLTGDMHKVSWAHLIFDPKYSDMVDIYEGGFYHARGVFRSEPNSCMRNKIPYYSTISRESIVRRIMKYAGKPFSYESFKANDVTGAFVTKSSGNWDVPDYDSSHHRGPVMKGEVPVINPER